MGENMSKNQSINNASINEVWNAVYYLYNFVRSLDEVPSELQCIQKLFLSLVNRLKLTKHLSSVLSKKIASMESQKKLTPMELPKNRRSPFDKVQAVLKNYREDYDIYENAEMWNTTTEIEIDLCRYLFLENNNKLTGLMREVFFSNKPANSKYPLEIKESINDFSSIEIVKDSFSLTKKESSVVMIAYLFSKLSELKVFFKNINEYIEEHLSRKNAILEVYQRCLQFSDKDISEIFNKKQPLLIYNIFSEDFFIESDMLDAIRQNNLGVFYLDLVKKINCKNSYKKETFSVPLKDSNIVTKLLECDSSCNILLYGKPGTGKSEFAKSIINEIGLPAFIYRNEIETKAECMDRLYSYLTVSKNNSILIIDEAENILKAVESDYYGTGKTKGLINKMLDNSKNKVIWIVNSIDCISDSTLRRFNYSLQFNEMPRETLKAIAGKKIRNIKISANAKKEIVELFEKYKITGASINYVMNGIEAFKDFSDKELLENVENILESNSFLLYGKKKTIKPVNSSYDLSALNTTTPVEDICDMVENAVNRFQLSGEKKGIRMLFYGLSGTGKTELARYLAKILNKKLLLKRASDILGMYVGENEKNIRDAFAEAEETDSILLFDEADSFFSNRQNANRAWERTLVNEFLTQMEEFSGILICTTNLRNLMDPAIQRRFHILTEFKPLKKSGVESLLNKYFPEKQFSETKIQELINFNSVTPGDFGALDGRIAFMSPEKVSSNYILNELIEIQKEKCKTVSHLIGFAC